MRHSAVEGVAKTAADGGVDVVVIEILRRDPSSLIGFRVRGQLAADWLAVKADVDRDADLATRIGDAMPGIAEDTDEPGQLDRQARLLAALPGGARGHRLLLLQRPGRDGPQPRTRAAQQQNLPPVIAENHTGRRLPACRLGRMRVIPVVSPPPGLLAHEAPAREMDGARADAQTRSKDST
jgi:hypothetical protein